MTLQQDVQLAMTGTRWWGNQHDTGRVSIDRHLKSGSPSDEYEEQALDDASECMASAGTEKGQSLMERVMFNNAQFSDMTILLGTTGITLPVHRVVIALRSPLLYNHLEENLHDGIHVITWDRSTVHTVWRVLKYIYEDDYPGKAAVKLAMFGLDSALSLPPFCLFLVADEEPPLLKHPRVFMIACQFQMSRLKDLALRKFERDLHNTSCVEDIAKCALEIYGSEDAHSKLLRPAIVARVRMHLLQTSCIDPFEDVCQKSGAFAVNLLAALLHNSQDAQQTAP